MCVVYNILCAADFHWGAMDADKQYEENRFITDYIKENDIDLFVIAGDWWNSRLLVNSRAAIMANKVMHEYFDLSIEKDFKLRLIDGTRSHDYDQNNIFIPMADGDHFEIIKQNTYEETLPGLKCLYCPDENMTNEEYFNTYSNNLFNADIDCMFFHGTFDILEIKKDKIGDENSVNNVTYEYSFFDKMCHIMVGGHWHDADSIGNLHYTRSPNRYKFGEDRPKGMIAFSYDTDTKKYEMKRIENPYTDRYKTYTIDTSIYALSGDINNTIAEVDKALKDDIQLHVKFKILITTDPASVKSMIDMIKLHYANNRMVKVDVENRFIKEKKANRSHAVSELKDKFSFLFDSNMNLKDIFKTFIKMKNDVELDDDILNDILGKYTERIGK